jgi:hypothetical protein
MMSRRRTILSTIVWPRAAFEQPESDMVVPVPKGKP